MKLLAATCLLAACGTDDRFVVSGHVSADPVMALVPFERTITHVMAVDPESASARRSLAAIDGDGGFEIGLDVGRPYVLAFIDDTAVGADMVVGVFRMGTLDTLSPQLAGHLDLGDTHVDGETASPGVDYQTLLDSLGLSREAAEYFGSIDDLSLRYVNPDIDADGIIDIEQDHEFGLDFHVRSSLRDATGRELTVDDLTDRFPDASTTVDYNLTSAYVLYPESFDGTQYVEGNLAHGAAYHVTLADGATPMPNTSFSSLGFGGTRGWGADYDLSRTELPGSNGSPATLAFTLGTIGRTLTFTNVVTRSRAALSQNGLAIFVRLQTTDGAFSAIDYRWMKQTADGWVEATVEEIALTIGSDGGHVTFHRAPSWKNEFGTTIPAQPSGSLPWTFEPTGPTEVCALAVSYDDKLGLRHFAGGAYGVSCAQ